jgi:hypothetical protein
MHDRKLLGARKGALDITDELSVEGQEWRLTTRPAAKVEADGDAEWQVPKVVASPVR